MGHPWAWLAPAAAVLAGAGWLLTRLVRRADTRARRRTVSYFVRCPISGEDRECTLERDVRTGKWTAVHRCAAFFDPVEIVCGRKCLGLLNLGAPIGRPIAHQEEVGPS